MLATRRALHVPTVAGGSAYDAAVLADTPVGFWKLNDPSGTTAVDSSGNGHDGTYSGSFSLAQASLLPTDTETCVNFTGGKMAVPDTAALRIGAGNYSVEAFFNASSLPAYATLWDDAERSYSLFWQDATNAYLSAGGHGVSVGITASIVTGTTFHVVATSDGTTSKVYINGLQVGSQNIASFGTNSASGIQLAGNPSGGGDLFQGKCQKLAVYNTVLSAGRVAAHWSAR